MKQLYNFAIKNIPTMMSFWSHFMINKTTKYGMRNKKIDHIHEMLVIVARKIVFCKKIVTMIMKIDVLKSCFSAKKARY